MKKPNLLKKITNHLRSIPTSKRRPPFPWDELPEPAKTRANALRKWRRENAITRSIPSYTILHNATLVYLAESAPRTMEELSEVPGMGPKKLETYGPDLLRLLAQH